jgi:hypothetical protein
LQLLEEAVVELNIVERASDNTIGRIWLNMAEAELSVLSGQCLDRRIPDKLNLIEEVAAWEHTRNLKHVRADWQFTTADARVKLKRLYPAL